LSKLKHLIGSELTKWQWMYRQTHELVTQRRGRF
jgi:hypothetical protein